MDGALGQSWGALGGHSQRRVAGGPDTHTHVHGVWMMMMNEECAKPSQACCACCYMFSSLIVHAHVANHPNDEHSTGMHSCGTPLVFDSGKAAETTVDDATHVRAANSFAKQCPQTAGVGRIMVSVCWPGCHWLSCGSSSASRRRREQLHAGFGILRVGRALLCKCSTFHHRSTLTLHPSARASQFVLLLAPCHCVHAFARAASSYAARAARFPLHFFPSLHHVLRVDTETRGYGPGGQPRHGQRGTMLQDDLIFS